MARKPSKKDTGPHGPAELVVMARADASFRSSAGRLESLAGEPVSDVEKMLRKREAVMRPMFGATEERVKDAVVAQAEAASTQLSDLSVYYRVEVAEKKMEAMCDELAGCGVFEAVYIKPPVALPEKAEAINEMAAAPAPPPPATSDFTARQIYLNAPPEGVNARWAWTQAGGRGNDVRIIDIEGAWRFTHEDLLQRQGGVLAGTEINGVDWRNHGTAVLGVYGGDVNGFGVTGICPDAVTSAVSHGSLGSAGAIDQAAARLRAGDIMLLEMHRPGPRHSFARRDDQLGYIAVEWWPDDFAAIQNAARRGIIVVEAAGNGAEDLDDDLYETPGPGFPAGWTNPFRRQNRDSGAVVVGAGAPPPGTHGRDHGPDRSRLGFSNYGALVDAQGWGREVTTCGYGDLQGGPDEDLWYTDRFSGTSSASPIVVGAIGAIQGMAKARGQAVLTPQQARNCLRTTGSPQQDAPGRPATQRIGNRPDIEAIARKVFDRASDRRRIAFRRAIHECRPFEIAALLDASDDVSCFYSTDVLQEGLVSAQFLRAGDSTHPLDLTILFRFSDLAGQSVEIVGPVGDRRYRWLGWIAGDGLGQIFIDHGQASLGSHYFDLIAEIQGEEVRYVFNDATQLYEPAGVAPPVALRQK